VFAINPIDMVNFSKAFDSITDYAHLEKFMMLANPESAVIDRPSAREHCPSNVIAEYVGKDIIAQTKSVFGLSSYEAIGASIREGKAINPIALLLAPSPPAHIHAMQRGKYWIGDTYSADLIFNCLADCGISISGKMLDYGCSSGALVRVLAAAYPNVEFCGTDPVRTSIDWARSNLAFPNLEFFDQDQTPPLPFEDDSFDFVSAVSIWSHHGIKAAKVWFDEMHRIIKPGGICIFTTHGLGSILHYTQQAQKPLDRFKEIYASYLACGFAFEEVWIGEDDSGNAATALDWGNSYFSRKVILFLTRGIFETLAVNSRSNQQNQDLYILRKANGVDASA
jgi:SAM-dependent methyltransferase